MLLIEPIQHTHNLLHMNTSTEEQNSFPSAELVAQAKIALWEEDQKKLTIPLFLAIKAKIEESEKEASKDGSISFKVTIPDGLDCTEIIQQLQRQKWSVAQTLDALEIGYTPPTILTPRS